MNFVGAENFHSQLSSSNKHSNKFTSSFHNPGHLCDTIHTWFNYSHQLSSPAPTPIKGRGLPYHFFQLIRGPARPWVHLCDSWGVEPIHPWSLLVVTHPSTEPRELVQSLLDTHPYRYTTFSQGRLASVQKKHCRLWLRDRDKQTTSGRKRLLARNQPAEQW